VAYAVRHGSEDEKHSCHDGPGHRAHGLCQLAWRACSNSSTLNITEVDSSLKLQLGGVPPSIIPLLG